MTDAASPDDRDLAELLQLADVTGDMVLAVDDDQVIADDLGDPFEAVPPEWRRLTEAMLSRFELSQLPPWARPFARPAMTLLAVKLAGDPEGSRAGLLELMEFAVCALRITRDELTCWDGAGMPYSEPPRAAAAPVQDG